MATHDLTVLVIRVSLQETTPTNFVEMAAPSSPHELVKKAILATATKQFSSTNQRTKTVLSATENLMSWEDANKIEFSKFCEGLWKVLQECLQSVGKCRSSSAKRGRLWAAFNKVSIKELPKLWRDLYLKIGSGIDMPDPLFHQTVSLMVYEELLREYFKCGLRSSSGASSGTTEELEFSKDELNILRYACGYVVLKVLKKYKQQLQSKAGRKEGITGKMQCEVCLSNMIGCDEDDPITQYTSEWFDKTNRGGLFSVNGATFTFFVVVEKVTRKHLSQYCSQKYENTKDFIVKAITEDCDVQFHWTLISHMIDEEEDAIIVLEGLASMWVTIRGFSLASTWLEEYKRSKKITVSKTKALRNTLKQND